MTIGFSDSWCILNYQYLLNYCGYLVNKLPIKSALMWFTGKDLSVYYQVLSCALFLYITRWLFASKISFQTISCNTIRNEWNICPKNIRISHLKRHMCTHNLDDNWMFPVSAVSPLYGCFIKLKIRLTLYSFLLESFHK